MSAVFLWILLIFCSCGLRRAQQSPCAKIDFNKPVVSGFQNCTKQYVPMFEVRNYVESPWLEPYRPSSQYFISNGVEGYSCGESVSRFQLDANSEIDAAIYLNFQFPGAFIEVLVIDTDSKQTINRWKNETAGGWFLLSRKINTNVRNAQIEFRANSNKNSRLAIEYLYVLNSAIDSAECARNPMTPPTRPPSEPSDTTQSSTSSTDASTTEPQASSSDEIWTILGIVFGVLLLVIILVLVVYVVIRNRKRKLLVVASKSPIRTIGNNNNHATLPRLRVVNDKVTGISIVGGNDNTNSYYPN